MVRSVAGNLPEQVKNNQSVNTAAGNGGQKMSQYSWFTVYLLIADRLGHEKIQTTLNTYSHLYPNKQAEVAAQLENVMNGTTVPNGSQMAGVANL